MPRFAIGSGTDCLRQKTCKAHLQPWICQPLETHQVRTLRTPVACYLQAFRVYKAQTVMFVSSNPESSAQPSGTIGRASNMLNRLDCSYQNCLPGPRDSVDAVYLVNAIDVCCSWPFEHRLIPFREPIVGMAGRIVSEVGFVFNNVSGSPSPTITNPQYLA